MRQQTEQGAYPRGGGSRPHVLTLAKPPAHARKIRATALVFEDPASRTVSDRIERIAPSDATVLIIGETGTGKELVARELHQRSQRAAQPFVALNCAALPEHIVESELFGHERGAFTGADTQRRGWFEAASGGTLFLDEVGDLPLAMQVKLLRVLQEREVNRVGSRVPIPINVRFIAATNVNLEASVRSRQFREDLYFRLNVARFRLPPLRERPGDILPLAHHFLSEYDSSGTVSLTPLAEAALLAYRWQGNIRELENVIQQALLVKDGQQIDARDLNLDDHMLSNAATASAPLGSASLEAALDVLSAAHPNDLHAEVERRLLHHTLSRTGTNQVRAAEMLGISRNVLRHRMKQHGLL